MKHVFNYFVAVLFALLLAGCAVQTTTDSSVGKADYQKFVTWLNNSEDAADNDDWFEKEFIKHPKPTTAEEEEERLRTVLDKRFNEIIRSAKALTLRHVEVRRLRDISVEMTELSKHIILAMYVPTKENVEKMEALMPRFEQLELEGEALSEKLDKAFGKD